MFRPRRSEGSADTGNPCHRVFELGRAARQRRLLRVGALLAVVSALALFACSDDRPAVLSDSPGTIADDLSMNAENFEYTIGQSGGTLTFATVSEPLTFNLALSKDASSSGVLGRLFEGLTETSWLSNEVEPALAESWTHSQDGLTWIFLLRQDVMWHDGEPFTAHDVEFTFNRIIYNPEVDTSARATFTFRFLDQETGSWLEDHMSVTALDDYTVQCVLPVPFAPFLRSMGTAIYPQHILESYVDDGTFSEVWDIDTDPAEIIGTGPFTIESFEPGERVVFQQNADYWLTDDAGNPLPYLDRIVQIIVPDLDAELSSVPGGELRLLRCARQRVCGTRINASRREFHHPQTGSQLRIGVPDLQRKFRNCRASPADMVPKHAVSPSRRAPHGQGQDHRRGATWPRVSTMVVHQPGRGRLPQSGGATVRIQRRRS